jgi:hypothetical protein
VHSLVRARAGLRCDPEILIHDEKIFSILAQNHVVRLHEVSADFARDLARRDIDFRNGGVCEEREVCAPAVRRKNRIPRFAGKGKLRNRRERRCFGEVEHEHGVGDLTPDDESRAIGTHGELHHRPRDAGERRERNAARRRFERRNRILRQ